MIAHNFVLFRFEGLKCDRPCNGKTFGLKCRQQCNCENDAPCNPVNGTCSVLFCCLNLVLFYRL